MHKHSNLTIVTGAILAFAAWELIDHMLLMGLPMFTEHAISFVAESALAVAAIFLVARAREGQHDACRRVEQMALIVSEALSSEDSATSPVKGVLEALEEIEQKTAGIPEAHDTIERAQRDAKKIQSVSRYLSQALSARAAEHA